MTAAARHRLEQRVGETFVARGEHEEIGALKCRNRMTHRPRHGEALTDAELDGQLFERSRWLPSPRMARCQSGAVRRRGRESPHQQIEPLLCMQPAEAGHHRPRRGTKSPSQGREGRIHRVGDTKYDAAGKKPCAQSATAVRLHDDRGGTAIQNRSQQLAKPIELMCARWGHSSPTRRPERQAAGRDEDEQIHHVEKADDDVGRDDDSAARMARMRRALLSNPRGGRWNST
jgi:hypothetical protein